MFFVERMEGEIGRGMRSNLQSHIEGKTQGVDMNPHPQWGIISSDTAFLGRAGKAGERERQAPALWANRGLPRMTSLQVKKIQN